MEKPRPVTFIVAIKVQECEPDLLSRYDVAGWVMGQLSGQDCQVVDATVWDSLKDLKLDEAEGKLEAWVLQEPDIEHGSAMVEAPKVEAPK